jgi:hypothetical protein
MADVAERLQLWGRLEALEGLPRLGQVFGRAGGSGRWDIAWAEWGGTLAAAPSFAR